MIKNNSFYLENLKSIVILGGSPLFSKIQNINKRNNIETLLVSSPDQVKEIDSKNILVSNNFDTKIKNKISSLIDIKNTLFISLGARWIFKKNDIINFFKNNIVNFHCTRLPFDKGGANISWKIINGDRIDNQLVHIINEEIDKGEILLNKKTLIPHYCKVPLDYINYHNSEFLKLYQTFILDVKKHKFFPLYKQPDYIGSYNPRLSSKISNWIDWDLSPSNLIKFINAFDEPYNGAKTLINNKEVHIKSVQLHGGDLSSHPFRKGIVTRHDKNWIVVNTSDYFSIIIEKILDKNKKNILKDIKQGDRFHTPKKFLDIALSSRIKFTPTGMKIKK